MHKNNLTLPFSDQIVAWSKLYGINEKIMQQMYNYDTSLNILYRNQNLIHIILKKNSQLVHQLLTQLPPMTKLGDKVGLQIDYMCPTSEAYSELFQGLFHPNLKFKEMKDKFATWFWDIEGQEFYTGPLKIKANNAVIKVLPTYVQTYGFGVNGMRHAIATMPTLLDKELFVYSVGLGFAYDNRKPKMKLTHDNIGIGGGGKGYIIEYGCAHIGYNPSSHIYGNALDYLWDEEAACTLDEKIKQLHAQFFKREEPSKEQRDKNRATLISTFSN